MENQLIQFYLFICQIYDTRSATYFQRAGNNSKPRFTIQKASKVRSTDGLMLYCWENSRLLSLCSFSTANSHIYLLWRDKRQFTICDARADRTSYGN